jgi:hypothetical protein
MFINRRHLEAAAHRRDRRLQLEQETEQRKVQRAGVFAALESLALKASELSAEDKAKHQDTRELIWLEGVQVPIQEIDEELQEQEHAAANAAAQ